MECLPNTPPVTEVTQSRGVQAGDPSSTPSGGNAAPVRIIVFDFATKQTESCVAFSTFFRRSRNTEDVFGGLIY